MVRHTTPRRCLLKEKYRAMPAYFHSKKLMRLSSNILNALLVVATASAAFGDDLVIKTSQGKVLGKASTGSVRAFLGVPFAAPPIGELRWKAPARALKHKGTLDATSFGHHCMQPTLYSDMIFRDPGQSEDCLTLNIWTPEGTKEGKRKKLPVMVWIYGGGFLAGGTSEPRQDGAALAQNGVVVVSMNYRLGLFGFFVDHNLAAENEHHSAGNYGLMDQAAALAWVRKNIKAFGGDPDNITLFGESAGSFSVSAQMASPLAKGMFAKAIGESGGAFSRTLPFPLLDDAAKADEAFASRTFNTTSLTSLRALSAKQVLEGASREDAGVPSFVPDIDGYFLPESVGAIYAEGKQAKIPLLAGWNKDEGSDSVVSAKQKPTVESLRAMAVQIFGNRADEALRVYAATNDEEAMRVAEDYAGDTFIAYSTWAWLEAQVKTGDAPVFRYRFDHGSPGDPQHPASFGAFHSDDIEYVFGNLDSRKGAVWTPEDSKLSKLMQTYWTNFAKTGNPNTANESDSSISSWPRYDAAGQWQVMHLDLDPAARPDEHRDRYLFLQSLGDHVPISSE
jgi:para-nitrobenzyl esterase